ncbi:hypothetical protein K437DRAFT_190441 [Tilletiaria anomala UBC 951]|uniref:Uncharacterized protein n=1 Tax=Tilletiaria anomala (strain ATCC 24038 / CBS 436.72 / UBC 951) TaxID=1037660 RepID=A0A066VNN6_TILAU|nr:uncharacterized protein K437DRAFT_190441 [Tilletiaria anomala UBC 951]KDN40354.1 hypothetical protein K437DRAFT_190441 [Tilletiaria anomala UBC 951]
MCEICVESPTLLPFAFCQACFALFDEPHTKISTSLECLSHTPQRHLSLKASPKRTCVLQLVAALICTLQVPNRLISTSRAVVTQVTCDHVTRRLVVARYKLPRGSSTQGQYVSLV